MATAPRFGRSRGTASGPETRLALSHVLPEASVSRSPVDTLGLVEQRERTSRPLLLDETGSLRWAARNAAQCSLGRTAVVLDDAGPALASLAESESGDRVESRCLKIVAAVLNPVG